MYDFRNGNSEPIVAYTNTQGLINDKSLTKEDGEAMLA